MHRWEETRDQQDFHKQLFGQKKFNPHGRINQDNDEASFHT